MENSENQVVEVIYSFFTERGKEIPSDDYDLFNSGLIDSMELMELIIHLENNLDIEIDQEWMSVDNFRNVGQISTTIGHQSG
jgi:acyl carrier protein